MNVRDNDVTVDFTVRVPAGVRFLGKTVNGEVEAAVGSSDVEAITVNGSIRISTTGYAEAQTVRSEEHTSELQSRLHLVCRLLLEKKKTGGKVVELRLKTQ